MNSLLEVVYEEVTSSQVLRLRLLLGSGFRYFSRYVSPQPFNSGHYHPLKLIRENHIFAKPGSS